MIGGFSNKNLFLKKVKLINHKKKYHLMADQVYQLY